MKLFVGSLPYSSTEQELTELFSAHGKVLSAKIITDRETGRSRGFGFVELETGGEDAIKTLNGAELGGRKIFVSEAKPREPREGR